MAPSRFATVKRTGGTHRTCQRTCHETETGQKACDEYGHRAILHYEAAHRLKRVGRDGAVAETRHRFKPISAPNTTVSEVSMRDAVAARGHRPDRVGGGAAPGRAPGTWC